MPTFMPHLEPAQQIYKEDKLGIRYYKILKTLPEIPEGVSRQPYMDEMDRILRLLYSKQLEAASLRKLGKITQAVAIYEEIVEEQFDDPRPYFQLCEHYARKKNLQKAEEICCAYLSMVQIVNDLGFGRRHRNEIAFSFIEIMKARDFSSRSDEYFEKLLMNVNDQDVQVR